MHVKILNGWIFHLYIIQLANYYSMWAFLIHTCITLHQLTLIIQVSTQWWLGLKK